MISLAEFLTLDLLALITATTAAISCALLGSFLLLRRQSLMGDAISHAVLPGIVGAFLISGSRAGFAVVIGAALAGLACAVLIEALRSLGKLESGAAMGVVFSVFFAAGVLGMEQAAARHVDLDADCLLYGQLESIIWYPPLSWNEFWSWSTLGLVPGPTLLAVSVCLATIAFVVLLRKELTLASFDPELATSQGFSAGFINLLLMVFVAAAVVGAFQAVGSILVIAMLIVPAAAARLLTDRLSVQLWLAAIIALSATLLGYLSATAGPLYFGSSASLSAAGMIAVTTGILFVIAVIAAPRYGLLGRALRQSALSFQVRAEDLLAETYRVEEGGVLLAVKRPTLLHRLLRFRGLLTTDNGGWKLTPQGQDRARGVIRAHRLWESYLVDRAGLSPDHVHQSAERLEHFTDTKLDQELASRQLGKTDPHGREIPE